MSKRTMLLLFLVSWLATGLTATDEQETETPSEPTASFVFVDEEARFAVREVADRFNLNLVVPESLKGKTTIRLREVTSREALEAILSPLGFSAREEGTVIVVSPNYDSGGAFDNVFGWFGGSVFWTVGIGSVLFVIAVVVICHVALSIGVLVDKPPGGPRFAPKVVWAFFVLWGGVLSLLAYWLIHHSNLRVERRDQSSTDRAAVTGSQANQ